MCSLPAVAKMLVFVCCHREPTPKSWMKLLGEHFSLNCYSYVDLPHCFRTTCLLVGRLQRPETRECVLSTTTRLSRHMLQMLSCGHHPVRPSHTKLYVIELQINYVELQTNHVETRIVSHTVISTL